MTVSESGVSAGAEAKCSTVPGLAERAGASGMREIGSGSPTTKDQLKVRRPSTPPVTVTVSPATNATSGTKLAPSPCE